jgi:hypothetical protein
MYDKGNPSGKPRRKYYISRNAVPPRTLHHWSQILADMETTQAQLGGKEMGLQGTPFEARSKLHLDLDLPC